MCQLRNSYVDISWPARLFENSIRCYRDDCKSGNWPLLDTHHIGGIQNTRAHEFIITVLGSHAECARIC